MFKHHERKAEWLRDRKASKGNHPLQSPNTYYSFQVTRCSTKIPGSKFVSRFTDLQNRHRVFLFIYKSLMVWYILVSDSVGRAVVGKHDVNKTMHVIVCQEYHTHNTDMFHASGSFLNVEELSTSVVKNFLFLFSKYVTEENVFLISSLTN
jgi:hypothetical protein